MACTWAAALRGYLYPVNLTTYKNAASFPGFFRQIINGNRAATIAFENYFRQRAPEYLEVWYEIVFWKLYSVSAFRQRGTREIIGNVQRTGTMARSLWNAVNQFVSHPSVSNLAGIRTQLGMPTPVMAVPLTFVAFANPETFPMIDKPKVAKWVNNNAVPHSANRIHKLVPFRMGCTSLQVNDFNSYLAWVEWCREVACVLSQAPPTGTGDKWRARDVEMAVFTAQRNGLSLSILPPFVDCGSSAASTL